MLQQQSLLDLEQMEILLLLTIVADNLEQAQQAAQADPIFQALLQNYVKNLEMSLVQQKNAQIGRMGVTPVSEQMTQQVQA